jgi:ferredoxin
MLASSSSMRGSAHPSTSGRIALVPARQSPLRRPAGGVRCRAQGDDDVTVALKFVGGADGAELAQFDVPSGEQLRAAMITNKVDLYTTWGKIWSCGGAGQCGTCIVDVKEASDGSLSERSDTENKKLKGKPASWRLACQTFVGDEQTAGQRVTIATKPQQ